MDNKGNLQVLLREYKELKAMSRELATELTDIENKVKDYMTTQGKEEIEIDIFKVSYKPVITSRLDVKALKAGNIDIYNAYQKQAISKRLCVV